MRIHSISIIGGLLLIVQAQQMFAQSDSLSRTLEEVVISASRQEERIIDAPRTITVIDRTKIENSVYNSVGDLLAKQQGLYVVGANQTPGTNQSLFLRGANSNQVTVLVDGTRITDPSSPNNVIDLSELSLTNVERIEIIEGSHSTLFGAAAIGGVVNIITRKNKDKGVHGLVGVQGGTFGHGSSTLAPQAEVTYSAGNGLYATGSIFSQTVVGLNAAVDTVKNGRTPDKDGFRKTDGYLKAGYRKDAWDVFGSYKSINQRAEIDNGAYQDDDNNYVAFKRNLFNYGAAYQISPDWKLSFNGSYTNSRRQNENDSSRTTATQYDGNYSNNIYHGTLLTNELQASYRHKGVQGVLGIGQYHETMYFNSYFYSSQFGGFESTTNYDTLNTRTTTNYIFGQLGLRGGPDDRLGITVGGRLSHHSLFGNQGTFEVNPSVRFGKSSILYASAASGFNAPSLYQLFDPTQGFGSFTNRGNKNLKPETSMSFEIGFKKEFGSVGNITLSAFHTSVKSAIEYVYLWNKNTPIDQLSFVDYLGDTYINITEQTAMGAELAGMVALGKRVTWSGNFTYVGGTARVSPADVDAEKTGGNHVQIYSTGAFVDQERKVDYLARRPKVTAFTELLYQPLGRLTLTADYRVAGRRTDQAYDPTLGPFGALNSAYISTYQLIDAGVRWQIEDHISVTARVDNIFNVNYQEIAGFSTRGRSAYVRLNYKW